MKIKEKLPEVWVPIEGSDFYIGIVEDVQFTDPLGWGNRYFFVWVKREGYLPKMVDREYWFAGNKKVSSTWVRAVLDYILQVVYYEVHQKVEAAFGKVIESIVLTNSVSVKDETEANLC